ncbi:MAG TPA: CvpA family protein [Chloroflexota bacterium]|jgi:uncharacterized protein YkwD|nr:CvpA family protein [Chloroflexota bacterium]
MLVIDIAVVLFVALFAWNGYRTGFLLEVAGLARLALGVAAGARFFSLPAAFLNANTALPPALTNLIGFVALFAGSEILLALLFGVTVYPAARALHAIPALGTLDRLLGIVPAALQALFWAAFVLFTLLLLPVGSALQTRITASTLGNALVVDLSSYEPKLQALLGNATGDMLLTLTPPATPTESAVQLHFPADLHLKSDTPAEQTMLAYLNQQRSQYGLPSLRYDPTLTAVARAHSTDMFQRSYFGHDTPDGRTPFDRMHAAGVTYTSAGENIAYAPNVSIADTGLMNSPEHRANILRPQFRRVGIGIVGGGLFEEMFTQDFAD